MLASSLHHLDKRIALDVAELRFKVVQATIKV
jgi:hypothetical protein